MFKAATLSFLCLSFSSPVFAGLISTRSVGLCEVFLADLEAGMIKSKDLVSVRFFFNNEDAIVKAARENLALQQYLFKKHPEIISTFAKPRPRGASLRFKSDEALEILEESGLPDEPLSSGRLVIAGHNPRKFGDDLTIGMEITNLSMQREITVKQAIKYVGGSSAEEQMQKHYEQMEPSIMRYGEFKSYQVVVSGTETTPIQMKVGEFLEVQFITPHDTIAADPIFSANLQPFGWSRRREIDLPADRTLFHTYVARVRAVKTGTVLVKRDFQLGRDTPRPGDSGNNPFYSVSIPVEIID